jgi:uncharacterized membrane protein
MAVTIALGILTVLFLVMFIVAFAKTENFLFVIGFLISGIITLAGFISNLTAIEINNTIKRCDGFVYVSGYYVDTATGLCFHGNYPIDCNNIVRILPEDIRACIIKNRIK